MDANAWNVNSTHFRLPQKKTRSEMRKNQFLLFREKLIEYRLHCRTLSISHKSRLEIFSQASIAQINALAHALFESTAHIRKATWSFSSFLPLWFEHALYRSASSFALSRLLFSDRRCWATSQVKISTCCCVERWHDDDWHAASDFDVCSLGNTSPLAAESPNVLSEHE